MLTFRFCQLKHFRNQLSPFSSCITCQVFLGWYTLHLQFKLNNTKICMVSCNSDVITWSSRFKEGNSFNMSFRGFGFFSISRLRKENVLAIKIDIVLLLGLIFFSSIISIFWFRQLEDSSSPNIEYKYSGNSFNSHTKEVLCTVITYKQQRKWMLYSS